MKTLLLISAIFLTVMQLQATDFNITTVGFTYSPNSLIVNAGDKVTISASSFHPLVQVDKATWDANGNTPLTNGWGTKTTSYNFTATSSDTIYFVCGVHNSMGMKGKIIVQGSLNINSNSFESDKILLFPNPVSSQAVLKIFSDQNSLIKTSLYNNTGTLIKDFPSENNTTGEINLDLNFAEIENGIYFLLINENKNEYYRKIIVMK